MTRELTEADKKLKEIFEEAKEIPLIQFELEGAFYK